MNPPREEHRSAAYDHLGALYERYQHPDTAEHELDDIEHSIAHVERGIDELEEGRS